MEIQPEKLYIRAARPLPTWLIFSIILLACERILTHYKIIPAIPYPDYILTIFGTLCISLFFYALYSLYEIEITNDKLIVKRPFNHQSYLLNEITRVSVKKRFLQIIVSCELMQETSVIEFSSDLPLALLLKEHIDNKRRQRQEHGKHVESWR